MTALCFQQLPHCFLRNSFPFRFIQTARGVGGKSRSFGEDSVPIRASSLQTLEPCSQPGARSDELTHMESHSCAKPGGARNLTLRRSGVATFRLAPLCDTLPSRSRRLGMPCTVRQVTYDLLCALGLNIIFGNPGSSELPFLKDMPPDFRYILGLHERTAAGMA